ncbi:hypothetical protein TREMEDRAFT_74012 [Tremella mesenterica DSM 1558]|uniref:uncharacterized protein n=1 Tax=Tremella mesenterica (strain ATCC 24925 / CBS 8224 / DSM 1558 / NBRC 9311 / NRRL Y-6157 / RJB 2259-6 / UBC 559-6) TaxID=578456 RepID=UPI0003F48DE4|nr:uncharacterized protein TREMEDRAFT_74012 [Tremella mesenterica DSM 1558]EIW69055.1 hypothetical protein TREMEDRAFT_74012 [Tremella mesenterica DSM 1558]
MTHGLSQPHTSLSYSIPHSHSNDHDQLPEIPPQPLISPSGVKPFHSSSAEAGPSRPRSISPRNPTKWINDTFSNTGPSENTGVGMRVREMNGDHVDEKTKMNDMGNQDVPISGEGNGIGVTETESRPWPVSLTRMEPDPALIEPGQAYYKLQFGLEEDGFTYYIQKEDVMIGRRCARPVQKLSTPLEYESAPPQQMGAVEDSVNIIHESGLGINLPTFAADAKVKEELEHVVSSNGLVEDIQHGLKIKQELSLHTPIDAVSPKAANPLNEVKVGNTLQSGQEPQSQPQLIESEHLPDIPLEENFGPPPPATPDPETIHQVDIDLGREKRVSRNHARLYWCQDHAQFCMDVYGRQGAWFDGRYRFKGSHVPLAHGVTINMGGRQFQFLLPPSPDTPEYFPSPADPHPPPHYYPEAYDTRLWVPGAGVPFGAFSAPDGYGLGLHGEPPSSSGSGSNSDWGLSTSSSSEDSGSQSGDEDEEGESEIEDPPDKPPPKVKLRIARAKLKDDGDSPDDDPKYRKQNGVKGKAIAAGTGKGKGKGGKKMEEEEQPVVAGKGKKGGKKVEKEEERSSPEKKPAAKKPAKKGKLAELQNAAADSPATTDGSSSTSLPPQAKIEDTFKSVSTIPRPPLPSDTSNPSLQRVNPRPVIPPPEIQRPFLMTSLPETPGRPGHIIVNVPIPPSGSGPRPAPGPLYGLDGKYFIGPSPIKPPDTYAGIIYKALLHLPRGRGTLGEICNWIAGEWEWYRLNVDTEWQNSIRHNLSLSDVFVRVPRIPTDDPESKGSVWIIDAKKGPAFEARQQRDGSKGAGGSANGDDRIKGVDSKKQRERRQIEIENERNRRQWELQQAQAQAQRNRQSQIQTQSQSQNSTSNQIPRKPGSMPTSHTSTAPVRPPPPRPPKPTTVMVDVQPITPALRSRNMGQAKDSRGQPMPFVFDGTTLTLDPGVFGQIEDKVLNQLRGLGPNVAIGVLSTWLDNKYRADAAKAPPLPKTAAAKQNLNSTLASRVAAVTPRPPQRVLTGTGNKGPENKSLQRLPIGPAPPGASVVQVIKLIADVSQAKQKIDIIGENVHALFEYIKRVGKDLDLTVAGKIWQTGELPLGFGTSTGASNTARVNSTHTGNSIGVNDSKSVNKTLIPASTSTPGTVSSIATTSTSTQISATPVLSSKVGASTNIAKTTVQTSNPTLQTVRPPPSTPHVGPPPTSTSHTVQQSHTPTPLTVAKGPVSTTHVLSNGSDKGGDIGTTVVGEKRKAEDEVNGDAKKSRLGLDTDVGT